MVNNKHPAKNGLPSICENAVQNSADGIRYPGVGGPIPKFESGPLPSESRENARDCILNLQLYRIKKRRGNEEWQPEIFSDLL